MKRRVFRLSAPALALAVVLAFSLGLGLVARAAPVARGGVTPADLPENKHPDKKVTVSFSAPQATIDTATGTPLLKLALLVGDNYPGTSAQLNYCVNDTDDVYQALTTKYGFPAANITYLKDQQCTDANIKAAIQWLIANSDANSTVVFYYSGHGSKSTTDVDGDGIRTDYSIVPYDLTRIWDAQLAALFRPLASQHAWLAFDSCYSGGLAVAGTTGPGRVDTFACTAKEYSYESSTTQHGYFTYFMVHLGMLQNKADANADGIVTVEEAFNYTSANIGTLTKKQHPVMDDQVPGDLNPGS